MLHVLMMIAALKNYSMTRAPLARQRAAAEYGRMRRPGTRFSVSRAARDRKRGDRVLETAARPVVLPPGHLGRCERREELAPRRSANTVRFCGAASHPEADLTCSRWADRCVPRRRARYLRRSFGESAKRMRPKPGSSTMSYVRHSSEVGLRMTRNQGRRSGFGFVLSTPSSFRPVHLAPIASRAIGGGTERGCGKREGRSRGPLHSK